MIKFRLEMAEIQTLYFPATMSTGKRQALVPKRYNMIFAISPLKQTFSILWLTPISLLSVV